MPAETADPDTRSGRHLQGAPRSRAVPEATGNVAARPSLSRGLAARMRGPGGCYNVGNVFALVAGLAIQMISMPDGTAGGAKGLFEVAGHYLFGSPGSTTLSVAIFVFMISGELYHRAWENGAPPDARLNHLGDLLAGVASLVLTAALVMFGDIFLAIVSGVFLAGGKFGSAFVPDGPLSWRFRQAVLFSRIPAVAALAIQFLREVSTATAATPLAATAMPVVMILSYLIWARADWLLLRSAPPLAESDEAG